MVRRKAVISVTLGLVILGGIVSAAAIDRTIPGIITGSSQFGNHEAPRWVFDNRTDTKWLSTSPTGWVQFEFLNNQAFAINSYAITSANDSPGRDPKAWTLLGSNDGTTWTAVDSRSNESWVARFQRRVFKCTNTTPYRMYRLNVTQNNGDGIMQFSELELIENGISRTAYYQFSWSSQISNNEGGKLVLDRITGSKWLTAGGNTTGWLVYQFLGKGAYAINQYAITSANDAPDRDPKNWTLQGSHDGKIWFPLDTRTNETWTDRLQRRVFEFSNAVAYSYYKLDVTANNGSGDLMGFSEFELLENNLPGAAKYVSPGEAVYEVPLNAQLDWEAGIDPNSGTGTWNAIGGHYVYLGTHPGQMTLLTPTALPAATTAYSPTLQANTTYYWMVEEALKKAGGGVYPAGDPNNVAGRVWRFSTETTLVLVNPESPVNAFAHPGGSASFTVEAKDPLQGIITYQWYYDPDTETDGNEVQLTESSKYQGVNTATLTVNNVAETDKGAYFCGVANSTQFVVYSKTANLYIKKTLAHWTLDAASYNGTTYADATGLGHHAVLVGTPTFANGIVDGNKNADNAVANGAVSFADPNSCADAGGFNPSAETNAFSISAWVNWQGTQGVTSAMIAAKRDNWQSEDNNYWIFLVTSSGIVRMQSQNRTTLNTAANLIQKDQWHLAVVTYEGGIARIYVDGLQAAVGNFTLANKPDAKFWIGRNESIGERFDGLIDDLKAFNYALSPEEVVDLYYAETGSPVCIYGNPVGDINQDCRVTIDDFSVMAQEWLTDGLYPNL
ncbi:LamG-like jellyroll fold domain-containing protein [Anaerohalosphaeraceae bacterium U12dextr]